MKTTTTLALMAVGAEALLSLDVNLPLGINVDLDLLGKRPTEDPCQECLDTWHPPHDVIIDDCDDTHTGEWHWVHPCPEHEEPSYTWGTSTLTATQTQTVISCPPEVPDCPAQSTMYTTVTIPEQTTICPVPVQTPAEPTHEVPEVHESTTMVPEVPVPTTHEVPYVPVPTKEISQPPPVHETPYVPSPPAPTTYVHPPATLSTVVNTPGIPVVPSVPVPQPPAPPVNTPVVPPHVSMPPYGNNATEPVPTPPIVTPPPAAGAAQNAQNMGVAVIAGLAAFALL